MKVVPSFKAPSQHLPEGAKENHKILSLV